MRKAVLLNGPIARTVAFMGHTDSLCIGDAGLPIPDGVERIDLAVTQGLPRFLDVLDAVTGELCVERVSIAQELVDTQPALHGEVLARIAALEAAQGKPIAVDAVPHEAFKQQTASCKAVIRTGEVTPYANIILHAGVTF
ncbi:D-ribose pyranase [Tropicimonas sediminicola]|uniref:D-ribose pyranase n=1 Tax=Tropicimonas sediminicola TaxID=1031541 RepID=A0A239LCU3_9RHOB|nr:D-ribose pyranase [Tropicimonas sediminicola]SNT28476.1 D-ribose pyranase [Tropicimonas sediminicola]